MNRWTEVGRQALLYQPAATFSMLRSEELCPIDSRGYLQESKGLGGTSQGYLRLLQRRSLGLSVQEGRLPSLSLIGKIGLLLGYHDLFATGRNIILPALTGQAS